MRNSFVALGLSLTLTAASAGATAPALPLPGHTQREDTTGQEPKMTKEQKKAAKLKRRERDSDVYMGSVAKQRRVVVDAADAQKDKEPADGEDRKESRKDK